MGMWKKFSFGAKSEEDPHKQFDEGSEPDFGDLCPQAVSVGEFGGNLASELQHTFSRLQTIPAPPLTTMSYIPGQRLLIVGRGSEAFPATCAISVDTKETVWKADGEGASCLVYSEDFGALFAFDKASGSVKIFDEKDGSLKFQSLDMNMRWMGNMFVNRGQLTLHCIQDDEREKVLCWKDPRQEARKGAHVELPSAQEVEHKERAESPKKAPVKTSTVETESTEGLENVVIKRPSTSTSESPTTTKKEASDEVMLKHSAAHDLPVLALRFTVMPSGILAFLSEAAPRDGQAAIHCYEDNAAGVSNLCTYAITCYHTHIRGGNVIFGILGISIGSLERLAVSCSGCRLITLLNLETGHSSTAFNLGMVSPTAMCLGEAGQMFVAGLRNIIQLSCSTEMFQLLQVIPKPQRAWTMTYVPEHRLIAFGCRSKEIHAISVDTKEALWKCNSGEANSLVYPAELGALLAGDSATNNIQVFNAADGTCIWKFRSPGLKVTRMGNLCVSKGQLMLHCTESDTEKVVSWQLG